MKKLTMILLGYLLVGCVNTDNVKNMVADKLYGSNNSALTYFLSKTGVSTEKQQEFVAEVQTVLREGNPANADFNTLQTIQQCVLNENKTNEILSLSDHTVLSEKVSMSDMLIKFKTALNC